jgi:hypothetical protein
MVLVFNQLLEKHLRGLRPFLCVQSLSKTSKFAKSAAGILFQHGSTGGGIYGLSFNHLVDPEYALGLLNSDVMDFANRQITTTFAGGYVSYTDAFLKTLPIPNASKKAQASIAKLSQSLTTHAANARKLEQDISNFPESVTAQKRANGNVPDLDALEHLTSVGGLPNEIRWNASASIQHDLLGHAVLIIPRGKNANCEIRANKTSTLELIQATLERRGKISRVALLALRIPERELAQREYLYTLHEWLASVERTRSEIQNLETELNDTVYEVFELTAHDRKVIESFLKRF